MKKTSLIVALATMIAGLCSCNKEMNDVGAPANENVPICFSAADSDGFEVIPSKAITGSTATMYFTATSGTAGSAEASWPSSNPMTNKPYTASSSTYTSGYFWGGSSLNFYTTNWSVTPTIATSGASISFSSIGLSNSNSRDYIAGCLKSVANGTSPVTIKVWHILGYIEGLYLTTADAAATATINSITLTPKFTAGKYTFASDAAGSWSGQATPGSATTLSVSTSSIPFKDGGTSVGTCSYTMIPSTSNNLTITIKYTVSRAGYTSSEFTKSADVKIPAGTKAKVVGTLSDDAKPISFKVSLQDWANQTLPAAF